MTREELDRLATAFAEEAGGHATPGEAYANCLAVSAQFAQWLRDRGVAAGLLHLKGMRDASLDGAAGRWPHCDPGAFEHWTTLVGDHSVDFTARQFAPDAQAPAVVAVDTLGERWETVETWACPSCDRLVDDPVHAELAPAAMAAEHETLARRTHGMGPFPDPRHLTSAPLRRICGGCGT